MSEWLRANAGNIVVIVILLGIFLAVIINKIHKKRAGISGCAGCASAKNCARYEQLLQEQNKKKG